MPHYGPTVTIHHNGYGCAGMSAVELSQRLTDAVSKVLTPLWLEATNCDLHVVIEVDSAKT